MTRWERPAAGREPAAAALLGWLADPHAPRLCLISGSAGCGKSALLAWLVHHGRRLGTPVERAIHAVVPLEGQSVRGTVWALADQLGVVARAPGELVEALEADTRRTVMVLPDLDSSHSPEALAELVLVLAELTHIRLITEARSGSRAHELLAGNRVAELDLDLEQWTDRARYETWRAEWAADRAPAPEPHEPPRVDLDDPAAVCAADALLVTAAYETESDGHGGLCAAWLRAGQSLIRDQAPADRALVLLTALGDGADPRLGPALASLAEAAPWRAVWSRGRGDLTPPWPGPVAALATGSGPLDGQLLTADHLGTVRLLNAADASANDRRTPLSGQIAAMAGLPDGTVLVLDGSGRVRAECAWVARPAGSGIEALLDEGPTQTERLTEALEEYEVTALTTVGAVAAVGDATGTVRAFGDESAAVHMHKGRVTALAALEVPLGEDGTTAPLIYSGGADGTVRVWSPGVEPLATPVTEAPCPVVALAAASTPEGPVLAVGRRDGRVEYRVLDTDRMVTFHPGSPIRALAATAGGDLLIGTDESLICLRPQ
ncbi:WD40 repeat domain-containing protein [Streptomyces sp. CA-135486]|uniref:WD40 repeat domain-containing protein n=1 Tax=Streptomyces sp. CA-135486 TaxID=3240049 RepID=UPI003D902BFC